MKFGVVTFPGSNCDQDMIYVLNDILRCNVVNLWHKDHDLQDCDVIILPGGFSYGDYLRSGAIARFSPIMNEIIKFAHEGGYVLGICNGFQILTESQLLPGVLLHNRHQRFNCKNVYIQSQTSHSLLTSKIEKNKVLKIPIAHGEGRYFIDSAGLEDLYAHDQILFKYCDEGGNVTDESNPNGSLDNIAGVTNKNRNVFGMMPHPERAADANLKNKDGLLLFESILDLVLSK